MSSPFEGGGGGFLIETGGSFNLEMMMVSVLHKEPQFKAQVQKVGGHAGKDQNQIRTSS